MVMLSIVVPYAVGVAGGERIVFLAGALVGFLTGLPLLTALRVLGRSGRVLRLLPFPVMQASRDTMGVPPVALVLQGLAPIPVPPATLDFTGDHAVICGHP